MNSVISNGFMLEILDKFGPIEKVIYKGGNYYALKEESTFAIKLSNDHNMRVDAHVWLDGYKIGIWRINPNSHIIIDKLRDNKKLIIYKEGIINPPNNTTTRGLLKIIYYPEQKYNDSYLIGNRRPTDLTLHRFDHSDYTDTVTPHTHNQRKFSMSTKEYEDMIFGRKKLTYSNEGRYRQVLPLNYVNKELITTMYARLVVINDHCMYKRHEIGMRQGINDREPPLLELRHPCRGHGCNVDSKLRLSKKYWFDNYNSYYNY